MQNGLKASGLSREKSREAERGRAGWKAGEDRKRARIARSKAGWTIELNTGDWPVGCWIRDAGTWLDGGFSGGCFTDACLTESCLSDACLSDALQMVALLSGCLSKWSKVVTFQLSSRSGYLRTVAEHVCEMRLREQIDDDANPEHHTNTNSEAILKVNNDRASTENSLSSWGDRAA